MNNPLETILQQTGLNNSYFAPTSRYYGLETKIIEYKNYKKHVFVKRRFIAQPEAFELVQEHTVKQGDRLDDISHQYLGDAEQFWRICDANAVLYPNLLTEEIGNIIKITMPEGMSGSK
jgi:nucleoid-associated protein YgaU